ncbi:MAG: sigma-54-dependent Fis family transcriptional regulator [Myxococcales bacterium]|nr:MAG: sigma-54-dependent Fis family transcriptional regulator [Myxococcales bacterium]
MQNDTSRLEPLPVLLVDDEPMTLLSFEVTLRAGGVSAVLKCQDGREALAALTEREIGVLLTDLTMPHLGGEELLARVNADWPEVPVIVVTGHDEVEIAVRCMRSGAFDYLVKPVEKSRLLSSVRRASELRELRRENSRLKEQLLAPKLDHPEAFAEIVTRNGTMLSIFKYIEAIARSGEPVMITGETGVGKELIARAVHAISRPKGSFVPVNVAGLDDNVFSDTLFGHRKGAFTGAEAVREGLVEQAADGTLFLDEIGSLSVFSQVKLLRLLQEREYLPLGADMPKRSLARVVVATNNDLRALQESGAFRKDLYYRLKTHHIHVPPLRERLDDLPYLVEVFLAQAAEALGKKKPTAPDEIYALLRAHHFPGNVRELRAMVHDAVSKHESHKLSLKSLKAHIAQQTGEDPSPVSPGAPSPAKVIFSDQLPTIGELTDLLVQEAMGRSGGNQTVAAQFLGISQQALSRRLKQNRI